MRVESILRLKGTDVFTIAPDATIAEAAASLQDRNVGALVVSADGRRAAGIISERDIARAYTKGGAALAKLRVGDLMTPNPVTCAPDDDGERLMDLMTERHLRHLPVVEDGQLRGMISLGDVVKHRLNECLVETSALRRYIATG